MLWAVKVLSQDMMASKCGYKTIDKGAWGKYSWQGKQISDIQTLLWEQSAQKLKVSKNTWEICNEFAEKAYLNNQSHEENADNYTQWNQCLGSVKAYLHHQLSSRVQVHFLNCSIICSENHRVGKEIIRLAVCQCFAPVTSLPVLKMYNWMKLVAMFRGRSYKPPIKHNIGG